MNKFHSGCKRSHTNPILLSWFTLSLFLAICFVHHFRLYTCRASFTPCHSFGHSLVAGTINLLGMTRSPYFSWYFTSTRKAESYGRLDASHESHHDGCKLVEVDVRLVWSLCRYEGTEVLTTPSDVTTTTLQHSKTEMVMQPVEAHLLIVMLLAVGDSGWAHPISFHGRPTWAKVQGATSKSYPYISPR